MFGLELWFVFALVSVISNGLSSFSIKIAAYRDYDSKFTVFVSGAGTMLLLAPLALLVDQVESLNWTLVTLSFISGLAISWVAVAKIDALRYIDTTIYFPLFKVVSPLIAIFIGVLLFGDDFSKFEWFGLGLSLAVPLLLITPSENHRQNNLLLGLVFVLLTGIVSALAAGVQKYITNFSDAVLWIVLFSQVGVTVGAYFTFVKKHSLSYLKLMLESHTRKDFLFFWSWRVITIALGFASSVYAYNSGGSLGIVYTIVSLYILIPIVLSIIFYNEHWNTRKVVAIILSVVALWFLK